MLLRLSCNEQCHKIIRKIISVMNFNAIKMLFCHIAMTQHSNNKTVKVDPIITAQQTIFKEKYWEHPLPVEFTQTKTFCLLPLWSCSPPGHRSGADEARKQISVFSMRSHQASYFQDWSQCHMRQGEDGKRASQNIVPEQWMCFSCWHPPERQDKWAPLWPSNRS